MDFIAKPFGMLLMWLYEVTANHGVAVILFALIVKLILMPFQMKSKKSMMRTSLLQERMKEIEKKHGANKQKYNEFSELHNFLLVVLVNKLKDFLFSHLINNCYTHTSASTFNHTHS